MIFILMGCSVFMTSVLKLQAVRPGLNGCCHSYWFLNDNHQLFCQVVTKTKFLEERSASYLMVWAPFGQSGDRKKKFHPPSGHPLGAVIGVADLVIKTNEQWFNRFDEDLALLLHLLWNQHCTFSLIRRFHELSSDPTWPLDDDVPHEGIRAGVAAVVTRAGASGEIHPLFAEFHIQPRSLPEDPPMVRQATDGECACTDTTCPSQAILNTHRLQHPRQVLQRTTRGVGPDEDIILATTWLTISASAPDLQRMLMLAIQHPRIRPHRSHLGAAVAMLMTSQTYATHVETRPKGWKIPTPQDSL
ncbi:hypothetical protein J4Q44_G00026000 [Coregonus suidteri]|uniref:Uncharacterized protein n=1 Tax=Coregonus suidteri TaxID=861788 RepID=A0AAN8M8Q4_9TELE